MAKTNGQKQQEAGKKASGHTLPSQVANSPTKRARPAPKERQSPIKTASTTSSPRKSPKKNKTAPTTISGELAAVDALEENSAVTVGNVMSTTYFESAPTTAAPVSVVNVSSPKTSITAEEKDKDAGKNVAEVDDSNSSSKTSIDLHESSSIQKQRKGKDKDAGKNVAEVDDSNSSSEDSDTGDSLVKKRTRTNKGAGKHVAAFDDSDSSSKDSDTGDNDDGDLKQIFPTPVKKQSGTERLQRGRKIKASSPAGRKYPTRTCFDLLFDLLFD